MRGNYLISLLIVGMSLYACEHEQRVTPSQEANTARLGARFAGGIRRLSAAQLPATIQTYLREQYAQATIRQAGQGPRGNYGVMIKQNQQKKLLLFMTDGTFKGEFGANDQPIDSAALPTAITRYLQAHDAGLPIKRVAKGARGHYRVVLQSGQSHQLVLFDSTGKLVQGWDLSGKGKKIELSELPAAITAYLEDHYARANVQGAGQGQRGKYAVVIEQEGERRILLFDQTGGFIRELGQ